MIPFYVVAAGRDWPGSAPSTQDTGDWTCLEPVWVNVCRHDGVISIIITHLGQHHGEENTFRFPPDKIDRSSVWGLVTSLVWAHTLPSADCSPRHIITSHHILYCSGRDEVLLWGLTSKSPVWHPVVFQQPGLHSLARHRIDQLMQNCLIVTGQPRKTWIEPDLLTNALLLRSQHKSTKSSRIHWPCSGVWIFLIYGRAHQLDIYFIVNGEDNFWPACGSKIKKIIVY